MNVRSLAARVIAATLIVAVGLALAMAVGEEEASALALPTSATTLGQQDGGFYAYEAEPSARLFLSEDGRAWRELPLIVDGAVTMVAAAPGSDSAYVLTEAGLLGTADAGQSWQRVGAPLQGNVVAMTPDPALPGAAFVATDAGQLYQLSEGGAMVAPIGGERLPAPVNDLATGTSAATLLAATEGGLFVSEDAGQNWQRVEGVPATTQLLGLNSDPAILLAATRGSGLYRSADGGLTWEAASRGLGELPGASLAITALMQAPAAQGGALYLATAYVLGHQSRQVTPAALYLSPDGGTQWIPIAHFEANDPVVTALLPERGLGSGVRAVSAAGTTAYPLDADRALTQLQSEEPQARLEGAKLLSIAALPTQGESLLPYLWDADGQVAFYVARALGTLDSPPVTAALTNIVEGQVETIVKLRALMALQGIADPSTIPALTEAFEEPALSRAAADALAAIGTEAAWQPILAALADAERTPQRQAAMAVLEPNAGAVLPWLLARLSHEDPVVRANVAEVLAWSGQPAAIRPLRALLEDPAPPARANAAFALGELGDTESITRLERLSEADPDATVRATAERAAARAQQASNRPALAAPVQPTSFVERVAAATQGWLRALILLLSAALALFVLSLRPRPVRAERAR